MILDACVLIALLDPADAHHERAMRILDCDDDLSMPTLTVAESLIGPARSGSLAIARDLLDQLDIRAVPLVGPRQAVAVAETAARHRLRVPDAVVLVAALESQEPLATFDERLASAARAAGVPVYS